LIQDDIALATDAMNKLQGVVLPSCERGGIRIEYARTKMGDTVSELHWRQDITQSTRRYTE